MKVLFDIVHPADVNFFSVTINRLVAEGHEVTCSVFRRGRLPLIMKKEFPSVKIILLGTHRTSVLGKVFGMVSRELGFLKLYLSSRFDVVVGFGFYAGMFSWIRGSRSVHVHDDKEYKTNFFLSKLFAKRFISLCPATGRNVRYVKSFKELAYLMPKYFRTDDRVLSRLGLKKGQYVYVREIANVSVNYAGSERIDYSEFFDYCVDKGITVLFDPEGDSLYKQVNVLKGVFTLEEHNSIKQHAALIVTSGDTVLREGALMGVPTVYTSDRVMAVNEPLRKKKLFRVAKTSDDVLFFGIDLLKKSSLLDQRQKAEAFVRSCIDINEVLYKELVR